MVSLLNTACEIPSDAAIQKDQIVAFYASKLSGYPLKFVEAACLAVSRNPSKSDRFLQEYNADVVAVGTKKARKESEALQAIRCLCEDFKKTYQTHSFWRRYDSDHVCKVVAALFNNDAVTPEDILRNYKSDQNNLNRDYDYIFKRPIMVAEHRISRLAQAMFLGCEELKYHNKFFLAFKNQSMTEFDEESILLIPSLQPLLQKMQRVLGATFVPQFFCAAIKITEQQLGLSVKLWCADEYVNKAVDIYENLDYVIGERWRSDATFAYYMKPCIARIVTGKCLADVTFENGAYSSFAVRRSLCSFLNDQFDQYIEKRIRDADQKRFDVLRMLRRLDGEQSMTQKQTHFDVDTQGVRFAILNDRCKQHLSLVEHGMQSVVDWATDADQLQREYFDKHALMVDCETADGIIKYKKILAVVAVLQQKNSASTDRALQQRYLEMLGSFGRKKQQERKNVDELLHKTNLAHQRNAINVWYRYAKLIPQVRKLAIQEASWHQSLENDASKLPLVQLDPVNCAKFQPNATSSQWALVKRYDPYFQPRLS